MKRYLGLDVGDRTIGVAVSDVLGMFAQALETIRRKSLEEDIDNLNKIVEKYEIKNIIVGLPKNMNGTIGPQALKVKEFVAILKLRMSDIEFIYVDERLSTVSANRILIESSVRRENRKKYVDSIAAGYILQTFLDSRKE